MRRSGSTSHITPLHTATAPSRTPKSVRNSNVFGFDGACAAGATATAIARAHASSMRRILRRELPDPDVAEAHRMSVVLERQRQLVCVSGIRRPRPVGCGTDERHVVLYEHVVVEDGHSRGREQRAAGIEARGVEDDVVRLPLAW